MLDDFPAKKRIAHTIPWGYRQSKHDPDWLEPVLSEVQLFMQAIQYLKTCSYKETAHWLSVKSGRYISPVGLMKKVKRIKLERSRKYETNRKVAKRQLRIVERELPAQAEAQEGVQVFGSDESQARAVSG